MPSHPKTVNFLERNHHGLWYSEGWLDYTDVHKIMQDWISNIKMIFYSRHSLELWNPLKHPRLSLLVWTICLKRPILIPLSNIKGLYLIFYLNQKFIWNFVVFIPRFRYFTTIFVSNIISIETQKHVNIKILFSSCSSTNLLFGKINLASRKTFNLVLWCKTLIINHYWLLCWS